MSDNTIRTTFYPDDHLDVRSGRHKPGPASTSRVSNALLNVIGGEHDISAMDKEEKLTYLYGIQTAYEAIKKIGWIEHTNDWDIEFGFRTKDGAGYGSFWVRNGDEEQTQIVMDFRFANGIKYETFGNDDLFPLLPNLQTETHIELIGETAEGNDLTLQLCINEITHVYIGE